MSVECAKPSGCPIEISLTTMTGLEDAARKLFFEALREATTVTEVKALIRRGQIPQALAGLQWETILTLAPNICAACPYQDIKSISS